MRRLALLLLVGVALGLTPGAAHAQGDEAPRAIAVGVGTVGGIATFVAATVYAVDGRSFEGPWVVSSLFTTALCGATAISLLTSAVNDSNAALPLIAFFIETALAVWPGVWVVRSALASVDPGDHLDGSDYQRPTDARAAVDPFTPDRRPAAVEGAAASFGFRF